MTNASALCNGTHKRIHIIVLPLKEIRVQTEHLIFSSSPKNRESKMEEI